MFTKNEIQQIRDKGSSIEQIEWQLSVFKEGSKALQLNRAASIGDGVIRLDKKELEEKIIWFDSQSDISKIKFVPASGAASRMFKDLFEFMDPADVEGIEVNKSMNATDEDSIEENEFLKIFFQNIRYFAFFDSLDITIASAEDSFERLLKAKQYKSILQYLLGERGMDYGSLPKGLLQFHKYETGSRTPFEEHLAEGINYAQTEKGKVSLHFTVSPEHLEEFNKLLKKLKSIYEEKYGVELDVSFSIQKPSTDTIAVDTENNAFREDDGSILFRPGGHGALIDNLNELDADVVFVKNIDNVVPEKLRSPTIQYKKALAAILLETREKVFELLKELDATKPTEDRLKEIYEFITGELYYKPKSIPLDSDTAACTEHIKTILNRPLRVCGVVKNLGEPGGGPFWAPNSRGDLTLQIVEPSQVDHSNTEQAEIFKKSTHFNPVDLICSTKNYKGEKFHLPDFVDRNTCFISKKSKNGIDLKALELPGLWNGAMADWLTLLVEVPVETFNPVKTVNDLLRPEHQ